MLPQKSKSRWPAAKVVGVIPGARNPMRLDAVADRFGEACARRLADALPDMRGTAGTVKHNAAGLVRWLTWVADQAADGVMGQAADDCRKVKRHLQASAAGSIADEVLVRVCNAYGEFMALPGPDGAPGVRLDQRRHRMSAVLTSLRQIGNRVGLKGIRTGTWVAARPGDRPDEGGVSLAEVTKRGRVNWDNPDAALRDLLDGTVSGHELMSFDSKMQAVAKLNGIRLAALRRILETELLAAYERFVLGERLLSLPEMPPVDAIMAMLDKNNLNTKSARDKDVAGWINEVTKGDAERILALFLTWAVGKGSLGMLPDLDTTASWRQLVRHNEAVRTLLGCDEGNSSGRKSLNVAVQELIGLGWKGWTAAFGILLIDTAWNVQPLLDLPFNPFLGGPGGGKRVLATNEMIASFKNRSGHEVDAALAAADSSGVSLSESPETGQRLSGVRVVEIIQEMTRRMRPSEGEGPLFLCVHMKSVEPSVPAVSEQGKWWNELLAEHADDPIIGGLPISRPMIRKTLTDIAAMENSGDHGPAQLLANHASGATTMQRYLRSPWFKREMANHIRRFQGLFEAAVASDIQDIATHLKVTPEELGTRRSVAMETGLGFACMTPNDGVQPGTTKGQQCTQLDRCHLGCPARRFVPTEQGLGSLVLTNRSLKAVEYDWIAQNPDRWRAVWMPLLAETEVYVTRLRDGAYRPRLLAAEAAVDKQLSDGDLSLILPW